jgi:AcrR family transcriptional regulator
MVSGAHRRQGAARRKFVHVNMTDMKRARPYTMTARAESAARTGERIVAATKELFVEKVIAEITLADIAARSGVTVQTILRRFGDKDSVFASAIAHFSDEVDAQRSQALPNALDDVIANLIEHYEEWGPVMLKMLAEEFASPAIEEKVAGGKAYHRTWCETMFSDSLTNLSKADRARRLAQLVAVCDIRTWELLRISSALSRNQTRRALREMLEPLIAKG